MRIYSGQYNLISSDIIQELKKAGLVDVEQENVREAELDVVGVLKEYNRMARSIVNRAKDLTEGSGRRAEMRMRNRIARERNFEMGDEALDYVVNQIIATFEQSKFIDEIYGTDRELRAKITPVMKKYTEDREEELDEAVRDRIKNLEEGSAAWDIEYEKVMGRVKRSRGLDDEEEE
jgi:hypothetical protein